MSIKIRVQGFHYVERMLHSKKMQLGRGKQSVLVGYGGDDVVNSTGNPYAVFVHEDTVTPKKWTKPGTGPKFLTDALFTVAELRDIISQSLKEGETLMQGLEKAGQLVLDRSEPLVPVDTGDLVESGFVRREDSEE